MSDGAAGFSFGRIEPAEVADTVLACRQAIPGRSTVDVVVISQVDDPHVLLVQRRKVPFRGQWALPGGYVEQGEAELSAAVRELREEAGISVEPIDLSLVGSYDCETRDPRLPMQATAFVSWLDDSPNVEAGSDAADAIWVRVSEVAAGRVAIAFDHVRILADALDETAGRSSELDAVIDAAEHRNRLLLEDVRRYFVPVASEVEREVLLREYESMKMETVERIKQRDGFINLNIVVAALIVGFAGFSGPEVAAWLALPWTTLCFGWAYLANDEKVSGLSRYFRHAVSPRLAPTGLRWEHSPKRITDAKELHKWVQLVTDLVQFVLPTFIAVAVYLVQSPQDVSGWVFALVGIEVVAAILLGVLFVMHSHLVKWREMSSHVWRDLGTESIDRLPDIDTKRYVNHEHP